MSSPRKREEMGVALQGIRQLDEERRKAVDELQRLQRAVARRAEVVCGASSQQCEAEANPTGGGAAGAAVSQLVEKCLPGLCVNSPPLVAPRSLALPSAEMSSFQRAGLCLLGSR